MPVVLLSYSCIVGQQQLISLHFTVAIHHIRGYCILMGYGPQWRIQGAREAKALPLHCKEKTNCTYYTDWCNIRHCEGAHINFSVTDTAQCQILH